MLSALLQVCSLLCELTFLPTLLLFTQYKFTGTGTDLPLMQVTGGVY